MREPRSTLEIAAAAVALGLLAIAALLAGMATRVPRGAGSRFRRWAR